MRRGSTIFEMPDIVNVDVSGDEKRGMAGG